MNSKVPKPVSLASVERVLATGFRWLRFPPPLEARFEADTGRERSRYLIVCGIAALFLYDLFLISDHKLLYDVFDRALLVRLAIVTPLTLGVVFIFTRNPAAWVREGLGTAMMFVAIVSAVYLLASSNSPLVIFAHYPLVLVIVYANVIQRLRFRYACVASAGSLLIYAVGLAQLHLLPWDAYSAAVFTALATAIFTLFANYWLEHEQRHAYLTALRDDLHSRQLMRANDELNVISNHDALTGLTNRRGFDLYLEAAWNSAVPEGQSIAVVMFDVDYFKRFNDRYGHLAGDNCLKALAKAARSQNRRAGDLIARFGGEEFIVVLPGADLVDGIRVGEHIRAAVQALTIRHEAAPARLVTVSVGVAALAASSGGSFEALMEAADAALYKAKNRGRNCVWPQREVADSDSDTVLSDANPGSLNQAA